MTTKKDQQRKTCSISEQRCKFCNRPLSNAESVALGYGVCCGKKNGLISIKKTTKKLEIQSYNLLEY
jgi:hypothetical protein